MHASVKPQASNSWCGMSLTKATQYVSAVEYISIEDLVQQGIKLVLLDRDNTCVPRDTKMVPPEVSASSQITFTSMRSSVALTSWELKEKALRVSRFLAR